MESCVYIHHVVVTGRKQTLAYIGGVVEIQTAITKDCQSLKSGSEIRFCTCNSIIHEETQKISSDFNKDITHRINPLKVKFSTCVCHIM